MGTRLCACSVVALNDVVVAEVASATSAAVGPPAPARRPFLGSTPAPKDLATALAMAVASLFCSGGAPSTPSDRVSAQSG